MDSRLRGKDEDGAGKMVLKIDTLRPSSSSPVAKENVYGCVALLSAHSPPFVLPSDRESISGFTSPTNIIAFKDNSRFLGRG